MVSSSSAVLLSLSAADFARAFKEVLDVRQVGAMGAGRQAAGDSRGADTLRACPAYLTTQAERLAYLRQHPLLGGVAEAELEAASEALGLAFFPPGAMGGAGDGRVEGLKECTAFSRRPTSPSSFARPSRPLHPRQAHGCGRSHPSSAACTS